MLDVFGAALRLVDRHRPGARVRADRGGVGVPDRPVDAVDLAEHLLRGRALAPDDGGGEAPVGLFARGRRQLRLSRPQYIALVGRAPAGVGVAADDADGEVRAADLAPV